MRNRHRILRWFGLLAVAGGMTSEPAAGQDRTAIARTSVTPSLELLAGALLDRRANIDVEQVTIPVALAELRLNAGVPLVFSDDLLPSDSRVTCACRNVTVRAALDHILAGTLLDFVELARQVIIEPRRLAQTDENLQLAMMSKPLVSQSFVSRSGSSGAISARSGPPRFVPEPPRRKNAGAIEGTVLDTATERPVPTVDVRIDALSMATFTDQNGRFRFEGVPDGAYQVTASRLGYGTQTEQVTVETGVTSTIEFRLSESAISLDAIVVAGYGPTLRRDRTGSISQLNREQLETLPIQTLEQALQGRTAGVQINSISGQPGSGPEVRIRGLGSINAGNRPLYIVDGVQISDRELGNDVQSTSTSPLASLNPRDIESVEVLKDAAASSIYGAQAANGVVLITTRRGREGATQWSFSTEFGMVESLGTWDVVRAPDWVELQIEAYGNRAEDLNQPREEGEEQARTLFGDPAQVTHYDWQNEILQQGNLSSVSASAGGGSADTRFFISGSHDYEEGQLVRTDFDRYTLRANLDHRLSERLSLLTNLGLARVSQNGTVPTTCTNCPLNYTVQVRPTSRIYNDDGSYNQNIRPTPYSPVFQAFNEIQKGGQHQAMGNVTANFAISPRLNFRSLWGVDYRSRRETRYRPPEQPFIGDFLQEVQREVTSWNMNQVLSYTASLGQRQNHNLSLLGGVEYRSESGNVFSTIASGLPSGLFHTLSLASLPRSNSGYTGGFKMASAFGRAQYDFANRFLFSGSLRYDGSSRFGEDFRYGLFYAASVGWDLKQESFLRDVDRVDELTLRASYGITGNSALDDFASLNLFGSGGQYAEQPALRPTQLGNNLLTWEEARTTNVGVQWSAFDQRFFGSVDVFRTDNRSLILDAFLPADVGFDGVTRNAGVVRNQGVELELGAVPFRVGDLSWRTNFVISYYENEIVELVDGLENIGNGTRVGHPLRIHWGARWAGVNPADGRPMWYDADGNLTYQVTTADEQYLGSPLPNVEGGWGNAISYKGFVLDALLQYSLGMDVYVSQYPTLLNFATAGGLSADALGRWQQPGDVTNVPRAYTESAQPGTSPFTTFSSRFIYDGSYIRLRTVTLGYDLPTGVTSRFGVDRARLYVQGANLWTATEFPGPDPEVQAIGDITWPNTRRFTFGIEVGR